MKKRVVIVVPIYKLELSQLEIISLIQLYRVLSKYPITYVMPEKFRAVFEDTPLKVEFFHDSFFNDTKGYSRLCLSSDFYKRFFDYEYMLIYQTDVFVFKDELLKFCDMGYDYIGAPWPRRLKLLDDIPMPWRVGNGGFSLRRISKIIDILEHKDEILASHGNPNGLLDCEDQFFTYVYFTGKLSFRLAPESEAVRFSCERYLENKVRSIAKQSKPFGCHGWTQEYSYSIFYDIIKDYGYDIPYPNRQQLCSHNVRCERLQSMKKYLWNRCRSGRGGWASVKKWMLFQIKLKLARMHLLKLIKCKGSENATIKVILVKIIKESIMEP